MPFFHLYKTYYLSYVKANFFFYCFIRFPWDLSIKYLFLISSDKILTAFGHLWWWEFVDFKIFLWTDSFPLIVNLVFLWEIFVRCILFGFHWFWITFHGWLLGRSCTILGLLLKLVFLVGFQHLNNLLLWFRIACDVNLHWFGNDIVMIAISSNKLEIFIMYGGFVGVWWDWICFGYLWYKFFFEF